MIKHNNSMIEKSKIKSKIIEEQKLINEEQKEYIKDYEESIAKFNKIKNTPIITTIDTKKEIIKGTKFCFMKDDISKTSESATPYFFKIKETYKDFNYDCNILKKSSTGIYFNDNITINTLKKKGGTTTTTYPISLNDDIFTDPILFSQIPFLIANIDTPTQYTRSYYACDNLHAITKLSNNIIQLFLDMTDQDFNIALQQNLYNINTYKDLMRYMRQHKNLTKKEFIFDIVQYKQERYNYWKPTRNPDNYSFRKEYNFYDYNVNYILGFEALQFKFYVDKNYENFIISQRNYLHTLSSIKKQSIDDYIKKTTFEYFINPFKYNNFNINDIKDLAAGGIGCDEIGNSFSDNIYIYVKNDFDIGSFTASTNQNQYNRLKNDFINKYIKSELINKKKCHPFYFELDNTDWHIILKKFIDDVNEIIIGAPKTQYPLLIYRASKDNYMYDTRQNNVFISNRISSFSINFDASKSVFYDPNMHMPTAIMYRTLLCPGATGLFITPLASEDDVKHEMEILIPEGQKIIVDNQQSTGFDDIVDAWNSVNMLNNLHLTDENKFKSHSYIIIPPTP